MLQRNFTHRTAYRVGLCWVALLAGTTGLLTGYPVAAVAQTLHAVIAADSLDKGIGKGAGENAGHMAALMQRVAQASKLKSDVTVIKAEDFSCEAINAAVDNLDIKSDDVVVFYYSGHGYRLFNDQSRFPRLACSRNLTTNPQVEEVALSLRRRNARLVLAISDSCNSFPGQFPAMMSGQGSVFDALRRLFDGYAGTAILAGADYGQFSWYTESGGEFSTQMLKAVDEETDRGDGASWDRIINAATKAREVNYHGRIYIQQPIVLSTLQRREIPPR